MEPPGKRQQEKKEREPGERENGMTKWEKRGKRKRNGGSRNPSLSDDGDVPHLKIIHNLVARSKGTQPVRLPN